MAKLSFDAYLGWVDVNSPNQIPEDARVISASDLLRYEKFGKDATARINEMAAVATDAGLADLINVPDSAFSKVVKAAVDKGFAASQRGALGKLYGALAGSQTKAVRLAWVGSSTLEGAGASSTDKQIVTTVTRAIQAAHPSGRETEHPVLARQAILDSTSFSALPGVQSLNLARGGMASDFYIAEEMRVKIGAAKPAAVFHGVGSNDQFYNIRPEWYKNYITDAIADLKKRINGPHVHVVMHMLRRKDLAAPEFEWNEYRDALIEIAAADPENVIFIDVGGVGDMNLIGGADPLGLMGPDKVHPTDAGHALTANTILQALALRPPAGGSGGSAGGAPTPPAGGTLIAQDFFARPDGPVGTAPTGQVWTPTVSTNTTWKIENNYLKGTGTLNMEVGVSKNLYVTGAVKMNATTRTDTVGVMALVEGETRRLGIYAASSDNAETMLLQMWIRYGEVNITVKSTNSHPAYRKGELNILGLLVRGSEAIAFLNGAHVFTHTLTEAQQQGLAGATEVGYRDGIGSVHRLRSFSAFAV